MLLQAINSSSPQFLRKLDSRSWRSLSGVRVNEQIVQLVPNAEVTDYSNLIHEQSITIFAPFTIVH